MCSRMCHGAARCICSRCRVQLHNVGGRSDDEQPGGSLRGRELLSGRPACPFDRGDGGRLLDRHDPPLRSFPSTNQRRGHKSSHGYRRWSSWHCLQPDCSVRGRELNWAAPRPVRDQQRAGRVHLGDAFGHVRERLPNGNNLWFAVSFCRGGNVRHLRILWSDCRLASDRRVAAEGDDGFTLVEMVVGLVVFSIVASIAFTIIASGSRGAGDYRHRRRYPAIRSGERVDPGVPAWSDHLHQHVRESARGDGGRRLQHDNSSLRT